MKISLCSVTLTLSLVACGGTTLDHGPDGGGAGTGGDKATGGTSGSTGGRASTGGTSGNTGGRFATGGQTAAGGTTGMDPTKTSLHTADYDQKCASDQDCALVSEGDQCCVGCMNQGAIAGTASGAWIRDRADIVCGDALPRCPGESPAPDACDAPPYYKPVCAAGQCVAHKNVYVDPSKYDTTCTTDTDCVSVSAGEICGCQCGGAAVSKAGFAQMQKDLAGAVCEGGGLACPCVFPGVLRCSLPTDNGGGQCAVIR